MPPTPAISPEIAKTMIRMRGDVDAGAARRLGVAADGVDVAAERRSLRDVLQKSRKKMISSPASGTPRSWLQIATTRKRRGRNGDALRDDEVRVADRDAVPALPRTPKSTPPTYEELKSAAISQPAFFEKKYDSV